MGCYNCGHVVGEGIDINLSFGQNFQVVLSHFKDHIVLCPEAFGIAAIFAFGLDIAAIVDILLPSVLVGQNIRWITGARIEGDATDHIANDIVWIDGMAQSDCLS